MTTGPEHTPEQLAAELERLRAEIAELDATPNEKGVVRLSGDLGGTADDPTVPALDQIEELREQRAKLREQRAKLLEHRRRRAADEATSAREDTAAEVERLREQQRLKVESRRAQIAAEVESGRIRDEREAAQTREDLAGKLSYERGQEAARIDSRLGWHDQQFERLNGSVDHCANEIEQQKEEIVHLRSDMERRFAEARQTALELAIASKQESRKLMLQITGTVLGSSIAAAGAIVVALLGGPG